MKRLPKPSLTITFLVSGFLATTISFALVGYIWISNENERFYNETRIIKEDYIRERKQLFKSEVEKAIDYINYTKSTTEARLRKNLRTRTNEAHAIASSIYNQKKGAIPESEIKELITEVLRPIRFNNRRGYYFIYDMKGINRLFAGRPELEGQNLIDLKNSEGRYVIRDMAALIKSKKEGFYQYLWTMPGKSHRTHPKLSFIQHFEPFNWILGTGEYLDDFEDDVKEEVLKRLSRIRYDNQGYIFVGQWDGLSLLGPAQGRNMWETEDENGVKIVQELIKAAKFGGGYVNYVLPKFEGLRSSPKISFAASIYEWQWYVGTGEFVDEIDETIRQREIVLKGRVRAQTIRIALLLCAMLILITLMIRLLSRKSRRNFNYFSDFFNQAPENLEELERDKLDFSEFVSLASSVNQMVRLRREAEQALKKVLDELESKVAGRTSELKLAMEEAESANRAKSEFLANISHELRNPMHHILSYSKYGVEKIDKVDKHKLDHYFRQIRRSGERLMILLNDLLDLSKMETGRMQYKMQKHNLWQIIRDVAAEFDALILEKNLSFSITDPIVSTKVICDEYRIGQVVRNLLSNAFKFAPDGTAVVVSFQETRLRHAGDAEGLKVAISDQGVGIPVDELQTIFDKFTQSSYTKTGAGGTGLGLAISQEIIESHQGSIHVENNSDAGSTFSFSIPYQQT